jgi:beta-glucosidase
MSNFLPAIHHAALCQSVGARGVKTNVKNANVGSTFSCSVVEPFRNNEKDCIAATKLDTAFNRLFIEPALGLGYPIKDIPELSRIEEFFLQGDEKLLPCEFDFIGLQYYFRTVATHSCISPFHIKEVKATKRRVPTTTMKYEIFPQGLYRMIKKFNAYEKIRKIIITECGICLQDKPLDGTQIPDVGRIHYLSKSLEIILNCRREGIAVDGFFAWSLTDNFEWAEGYSPRFGLVYIEYPSQKRIMKDSGKWFKEFLSK